MLNISPYSRSFTLNTALYLPFLAVHVALVVIASLLSYHPTLIVCGKQSLPKCSCLPEYVTVHVRLYISEFAIKGIASEAYLCRLCAPSDAKADLIEGRGGITTATQSRDTTSDRQLRSRAIYKNKGERAHTSAESAHCTVQTSKSLEPARNTRQEQQAKQLSTSNPRERSRSPAYQYWLAILRWITSLEIHTERVLCLEYSGAVSRSTSHRYGFPGTQAW